MNKKCQSRKKNGTRCQADAQVGKEFCVFHDPSRVGEGHRARRAGGIKRSQRAAVLPPETPDCPLTDSAQVSTLIATTINQLRRGQLDPRIANAIGYLAAVQLRAFEQSMSETRIRNMERILGLLPRPDLAARGEDTPGGADVEN